MKPFYQLVIFFLIFSRFPFSAISADYTNLIFKGCANQKFPDPSGIFSQNLNNLFSSLAAQSAQRSFATTTAGSDQNALVGLFQCRGDLTASQCYDCVSRIPKLVPRLCGGDNAAVVAARVQLAGCYLRYEVSGFRQTDPMEMLYRICGKRHSGDAGFAGKRETAFGMVENGVKSSGGGGGGVLRRRVRGGVRVGSVRGQFGKFGLRGVCEEWIREGEE